MKGIIGLVNHSDEIIGNAFDILSLEALFLVPRYVVVKILLMGGLPYWVLMLLESFLF
jgi:hypothetical protein